MFSYRCLPISVFPSMSLYLPVSDSLSQFLFLYLLLLVSNFLSLCRSMSQPVPVCIAPDSSSSCLYVSLFFYLPVSTSRSLYLSLFLYFPVSISLSLLFHDCISLSLPVFVSPFLSTYLSLFFPVCTSMSLFLYLPVSHFFLTVS